MIIPTPEYNPMFAQDGIPFREKMIDYIRREFGTEFVPRFGLGESDAGSDAQPNRSAPKDTSRPLRRAA